MTPVVELERDDDLVRHLLAPLERVQPVTLPHRTARRRSRRPLVLSFAVGAALLLLGGLALASVFGPLHNAVLKVNPPALSSASDSATSCQLIGQTAGKAEEVLAQRGYRIEWRFQHWGTQSGSTGNSTTPTAVTGGYTDTPAAVPANSVVWDITADSQTANAVFVFVQAPNDPNAPTIVPPACPAHATP